MKNFSLIFGFLFFLFFLFPPSSYAARSLSINSTKSALFGEEDMQVNTASLSGFTNGETIYLKGAFYQDGSTNYFGYTKNGDNWIKNGDSTVNQMKVKIGDWDGNMIIKADFSDSGYKGEGTYKFKVGFYYLTSGGNLSSINWSSNSLDINVSEPDPTPTPTQVPTEKPSPHPTFSTVQVIATVKLGVTNTVSPTKKLSLNNKNAASLAALQDVLGTKSGEKKSATLSAKQNSEKKTLIKGATVQVLSAIFIIAGAGLIIACAILMFIKRKK